jgi:hypothetical protein
MNEFVKHYEILSEVEKAVGSWDNNYVVARADGRVSRPSPKQSPHFYVSVQLQVTGETFPAPFGGL